MTNCVNCGQQISMGVTICPYCGAAQQGYVQPQQSYSQPMMDWWTGTSPDMQGQQMGYGGQNMYQSYGQTQQSQPGAKKPVNGKKIGIIAGVAVALVFVIVLVIKFSGPGAPTQKAAIKSYIKAIINQDADAYMDVCFSKELLKGIEKKYDVSKNQLEGMIKIMLSWYPKADNVRKIKIIYIDEMDKSDIKNFEDGLKDDYNVKINVSELVYMEYEYEVKEDGKWEKDDDTAVLYKTGGKWFVMGDVF